MIVPGLVIAKHPFLNTFSGNLHINMYLVILTALCRQHAKLQRIEGASGVSVCHVRQKICRIILQNNTIASHTPLVILHRAEQKLSDILLCKRL